MNKAVPAEVTEPHVRAATVPDAAAIAAVQHRSWEAAYRQLEPATWMDGWTLERRTAGWARRLAQAGIAVWVAGPGDGPIAGFCGLALPSRDDDGDEDTAEITSFYVDPGSWRGGIGRALMQWTLDDLGTRGFTEVTLWVFDANARARAFYETFGFTADGAAQTLPDEPPEMRLRRFV